MALLRAMEEYFYAQVDAGRDADDVLDEILSLVRDDLAMVVDAYKATHKE